MIFKGFRFSPSWTMMSTRWNLGAIGNISSLSLSSIIEVYICFSLVVFRSVRIWLAPNVSLPVAMPTTVLSLSLLLLLLLLQSYLLLAFSFSTFFDRFLLLLNSVFFLGDCELFICLVSHGIVSHNSGIVNKDSMCWTNDASI